MSSLPTPPPVPNEGSPPPSPEDLERDEFEDYIDGRLHQTRRQVKGVDLAAALLTLFVGTLCYLLVAAVLDHWVVTGGLSFGGRLLLLAGLLVAGGAYFVVRILPLLIRRINPVFAAQTIEQSRPSLKNGLVNFLFLRHERRELQSNELARKVFQGLEEKTAAELADPAVDMAVDRSEIIRLGYALIAVVAICALYLVFSPKNPLASFGRVMMPWAKIQAPTRVAIGDVQPGNHTAFQGDTLTVSADVTGINPGEPVTLYYTTSDGQSVNQAIPMSVPDGQYRYFCNLPPGSAGLQQDLEYYVAAGDARSERFQIHVEIPLTILVDKVHYEYPKYTGIPARDTTSGDIRAIEGTKVTLSATASQPIRRATVEMNGDSRSAKAMDANGTQATGQFSLAMDAEEPTRPKYSSYQLRFTDSQGRTNPRPIRHEIDVIRDLPPEVRWIDPPDDEAQLPVNGAMELKLRAEDPDYALRRAGFHAERKDDRGNMSLPIAPLLEKHAPAPPHQGSLEGTYRFEPAKLGLKAGDKVVIWAQADDNREPVGNHSESDRRTIVIVEPQQGESQQGTQQKQGQGEQQKDQPGQKQKNQPAQGRQGRDGAAQQDQTEQQKQDQQQPHQQENQTPPQDQGDQASQQKQQSREQQKGDQKGKDSGSGSNQGGDNAQQQSGESGNEGDKQDQGQNAQQQQQQQQQQQGQGQSSAGGQQGQQKNQGQQGGQGQQGQQGQQGRQDQQGDQGQKSAQGSQEQSAERQPVDGQTNPGQAFEEILEHRQKEQQQNKPSGGQQQPSQQQPSQQQPSQQQPSQQQPQSPSQGSGQPGSQEKSPQPNQPQQPQQSQGQGAGQQPRQDQPKDGQSQTQQPGTQQNSGTDKPPSEAQKNAGAQPDTKQPSDQQSSGGSQQGGSQPKPGQSQPSGEEKPAGDGTGSQNQPSGASEPSGGQNAQQGKGDPKNPQQKSGGQPSDASLNKDQQKPGNPQSTTGEKPSESQGDSGSAGSQPQGAKPQPTPGEKAAQQPGGQEKGQPQPSQGSPGSGKPSADKQQGTPAPQQMPQAREKRPAGDRSQEKPSGNEATSPNTQPKESDSQGDAGGDRSGGGERGGGQKTSQPGAGSEGSQQEAQEGGQASDQQGKGETGSKPGQQAPSDQATGQPAGQPGAGKDGSGKPQQQPGGNQPGAPAQGQSPQQPSGDNAQQPPNSEGGASGGQQPNGNAAGGSGNPTQGGVPGGQNTPGSANPTGPLGADDPNLDYANRQTDLALDHLRHEMKSNQSDLLDRLGWTKQDAERFVQQWEQLKQAAGRQDDQGRAARKELKDALDSLGLRPRGTQLQGGHTSTDRVRGLHEDRRVAPPKEYAEQVQAYTKGLSETEEPSTGPTAPPKAPGR